MYKRQTEDGVNFRAAKRTAPLNLDERFYNFQTILDELQPKFTNIWQTLKASHPHMSQLTFFGEIIGGAYGHPEVSKNNQAIKVQKGIAYSPDNHFFAFDIMLNATTFLSVSEANFLFEKEGLLHAKKYN